MIVYSIAEAIYEKRIFIFLFSSRYKMNFRSEIGLENHKLTALVTEKLARSKPCFDLLAVACVTWM